ncbi:MAG: HAMP domain-containing sensor histidine kinase [Eubacteriales bacterium]|nr:HAMP domain-containing sensor histidine kinase [Eubacteriales bacterium]
MLDEAISGEFQEADYDESRLSRLESRWKQFLEYSSISRANLEKEKENIKSLISDISHQTKTPMTNIKLYVSLLSENLEAEEESPQREENQRLLAEIGRQTDKLEFLIDALTKMSRLESNLVEVRPQREEIGSLIAETVQEALLKAEKKEIHIQQLFQGEMYAIFDRKWTKEALGNVLDNAVKYAPNASTVTISVTEYGLYTAISVKDEGPGIREEEIPKIFGRFYRAREMHKEEGVGIGLYLAREILRKQDGYIKVNSAPGQGSEFQLYLKRQ